LKPTEEIIEHFYRHEYARLIALLSSRVGVRYLEDIEDSVQFALMTSSHTWPAADTPDNPTAWLYRVATNKLMSTLGQQNNRKRILAENVESLTSQNSSNGGVFMSGEIRDSMLKMLFICCDDSLSERSQLVASLKMLCGFQTREIAAHLHVSEASVHKRYERARDSLTYLDFKTIDEFDAQQFTERVDAVLSVLYAMFSEGYLSSRDDQPIRKELCLEAMRLAKLLTEHEFGSGSNTSALIALMHFHLARIDTRTDTLGTLILLEDQDRTLWDREKICAGMAWLEKSATGDVYSRYHAEASIAAEHCISPCFSATRWDVIVKNYERISKMHHKPNPIVSLNHALALAEFNTPQSTLQMIGQISPQKIIQDSSIWNAALSDLHRRCGNADQAGAYAKVAVEAAPSEAIRSLLKKRLMDHKASPHHEF